MEPHTSSADPQQAEAASTHNTASDNRAADSRAAWTGGSESVWMWGSDEQLTRDYATASAEWQRLDEAINAAFDDIHPALAGVSVAERGDWINRRQEHQLQLENYLSDLSDAYTERHPGHSLAVAAQLPDARRLETLKLGWELTRRHGPDSPQWHDIAAHYSRIWRSEGITGVEKVQRQDGTTVYAATEPAQNTPDTRAAYAQTRAGHDPAEWDTTPDTGLIEVVRQQWDSGVPDLKDDEIEDGRRCEAALDEYQRRTGYRIDDIARTDHGDYEIAARIPQPIRHNPDAEPPEWAYRLSKDELLTAIGDATSGETYDGLVNHYLHRHRALPDPADTHAAADYALCPLLDRHHPPAAADLAAHIHAPGDVAAAEAVDRADVDLTDAQIALGDLRERLADTTGRIDNTQDHEPAATSADTVTDAGEPGRDRQQTSGTDGPAATPSGAVGGDRWWNSQTQPVDELTAAEDQTSAVDRADAALYQAQRGIDDIRTQLATTQLALDDIREQLTPKAHTQGETPTCVDDTHSRTDSHDGCDPTL